MLPTPELVASREQLVDNIIAAWYAATPEQLTKGRCWYHNAHMLAIFIADNDALKGAGVLAALSANKRWSDNRKLAADALQGNIHGHVGDALRKTAAIIAGTPPEDILPMDLKTGHFYRCIFNPNDPDAVVIDRHAYDIATAEVNGSKNRGLSKPNRYALIAHCYREAALRLGELPSTVQAVTWVAHVERR